MKATPIAGSSSSISRSARWISGLLVVFIVLFPKGGIKVYELPITWGYLFFGIAGLISLPSAIWDSNRYKISRLCGFVLLCLLPFQCIILLTFTMGSSATAAAPAITNFFIFPLVFLLLWRRWYLKGILSPVLKLVTICVFIAAVYGIFLFAVKLATGKLLEVPFLTVNAADVGSIELKDNLRGGLIMKLISTYNNGNVYGAATILLLPLFDALEASKLRRIAVRIALILTLSRTAWFGLLLDQMLTALSLTRAAFSSFPRVRLLRLKKTLLSASVVLVLAVPVMALAYAPALGFLFSSSADLGGRVGQLEVFRNFTLFPPGPYDGFAEMVFPSALRTLGLVGFLSMLVLFLTPMIYEIIDHAAYSDPIRRAAIKGLLLYFAVAWIDGAIDLIPIMAFYWFVVVIAIYGKGADLNLSSPFINPVSSPEIYLPIQSLTNAPKKSTRFWAT